MVCDVVEVAAGVGVVWARRDGVVALVAAVVSGVVAAPAVLAFAESVWVVLAGVVLLLLVAVFAAGAFVLGPSTASSVSLAVATACVCCSAVA